MKPEQTVTPVLLTAKERIAATLQIKVSCLSATHASAVAALIVNNQIPGVSLTSE